MSKVVLYYFCIGKGTERCNLTSCLQVYESICTTINYRTKQCTVSLLLANKNGHSQTLKKVFLVRGCWVNADHIGLKIPIS